MAADNQDSLLAPTKAKQGFMFPKSFIIWVFGFMVAGLVIAVVAKNLGSSPKKETSQVAAAEKDVASNPPPASTIDEIAANQKAQSDKEKDKDQKKKTDEELLAQAKDAGSQGDSKLVPNPLTNQKGQIPPPKGSNEDEQMNAARENLQRDAKSMVFDQSIDPQQAAQAAQAREKGDANSAAEEAARKQQDALAKSTQQGLAMVANSLSGGMTQVSATKKDREWLKEVGTDQASNVVRSVAPAARYMLTEGTVVNAVLMNAVNSDLPGSVSARVTVDIFDSITQTKKLLPRGAILTAPYSSDIRVGQDRVFFAFKRLILPNGVSANLPGTPGTDASGRSGVSGDVNNHYGQMFYLSTIGALGAYVTKKSEADSNSGVTINTGPSVSGSAAQVFSDMAKAVIDRNKAMAPTITIPSGVKVNFILGSDMVLPPYQAADN